MEILEFIDTVVTLLDLLSKIHEVTGDFPILLVGRIDVTVPQKQNEKKN